MQSEVLDGKAMEAYNALVSVVRQKTEQVNPGKTFDKAMGGKFVQGELELEPLTYYDLNRPAATGAAGTGWCETDVAGTHEVITYTAAGVAGVTVIPASEVWGVYGAMCAGPVAGGTYMIDELEIAIDGTTVRQWPLLFMDGTLTDTQYFWNPYYRAGQSNLTVRYKPVRGSVANQFKPMGIVGGLK